MATWFISAPLGPEAAQMVDPSAASVKRILLSAALLARVTPPSAPPAAKDRHYPMRDQTLADDNVPSRHMPSSPGSCVRPSEAHVVGPNLCAWKRKEMQASLHTCQVHTMVILTQHP